MSKISKVILILIVILPLLSSAQRISPEAYIELHKDAAIQHMETYGCPASIILAVAMHESATGNSKIARHLNNHFGIKGPNNSKVIRSAYKGYPSVADSYADFVGLLKRRKRTRTLFDRYGPHEYRSWVKGIARSGYAHATTWSTRVLNMIETYNLDQYDLKPAGSAISTSPIVQTGEHTWYTVQPGDTLSEIAQQYDTTVRALRRANGISGSQLEIGQKLLLE